MGPLQRRGLTPRGRCTACSLRGWQGEPGCTIARPSQGERQSRRRLEAGSGDSSARRSAGPSQLLTQGLVA